MPGRDLCPFLLPGGGPRSISWARHQLNHLLSKSRRSAHGERRRNLPHCCWRCPRVRDCQCTGGMPAGGGGGGPAFGEPRLTSTSTALSLLGPLDQFQGCRWVRRASPGSTLSLALLDMWATARVVTSLSLTRAQEHQRSGRGEQ